jgi:hypothetical protein
VAGATVITLPSTSTTLVSSQWTTTGLNISYTTGNVGIGTTSSSAPLNVQGEATGGLAIRLNGRSSDNYSELAFWNNANSTNYGILGADQAAMYFGTNTSLPVLFTTNSAERMRLTSAGKLGIGTTAPNNELEVVTSSNPSIALTSTSASLYSYFGMTSGTVGAQLYTFGQSYSAVYPAGCTALANNTYGIILNANNATGILRFQTNDTERARITSSGNLLVGATSTAGNLVEIYNNSNQGGRINFYKTTSGAFTAIGNYYNGSYVGGVNYDNSSTSFPTSSDVRLKKDIVDASSASAKIDQIRIVSHGWKHDSAVVEFGVVAQELVNVAPQAVAVGDDGEEIETTWGVDYSKLVPLLIKAHQELKAEFDAYKASHP